LAVASGLLIGLAGCEQETSSSSTETPVAATDETPRPVAAAETPSLASATEDAPSEPRPAEQPSDTVADRSSLASTSDTAVDKATELSLTDTAANAPKQIAATIVVEPDRLDLGEIPTNDAKTGTVTLTNTGEEPRAVVDCRRSCGCTSTNCPKGKVLQPGESVDVEIRLNGGTTATRLSKNVTFVISDSHPPVQLPVVAEAISFVVVEPAQLDPDSNPEGTFKLRSIDDQPFTVKSVFPSVIEEFDTEPKNEHELTLPWDRWREYGQQQRLLFTLDHPKCSRVEARIPASAIDPTVARPPTINVPPISSPRSLDRLLREGQTDQILTMIDEGTIDVNSIDPKGQSPLVKAAHAGDVVVMAALIDASADIAATDRVGRTPLMFAAQSKNAEAVEVMLEAGADHARRDTLGNTALSWAAGFGDVTTVDTLIKAGADVNVTGSVTGFTPIIWAAGFGKPESVAALVEAGANIEDVDQLERATPLMHAVRTGGADNVQVLVEAGANLEARDKNEKTPLLVAAANSGASVEVIRLLLDAGADPTATTANGKTAQELARTRTDVRAAEVIELLESVAPKEGG
jgi:ankyrin repeat protein